MANMAKKSKKESSALPALKFAYECPLCGEAAIESSDMMLGVQVACRSCGEVIDLDDEGRYTKLAKPIKRSAE